MKRGLVELLLAFGIALFVRDSHDRTNNAERRPTWQEILAAQSQDFIIDRGDPGIQAYRGDGQEGSVSARKHEFLEQCSLDTLKIVGTLRLGGQIYALVETRDGLVHRLTISSRGSLEAPRGVCPK
jgi:Pilus assembly protein, PilP